MFSDIGGLLGLLQLGGRALGYQDEVAQVRAAEANRLAQWQRGLDNISSLQQSIPGQVAQIAGQTGQAVRDTLGGVTNAYSQALSAFDKSGEAALGEIGRFGSAEQARIEREAAANLANSNQALTRRGMGSSYLMNANAAINAEFKNRQTQELQDRLAMARANTGLNIAGQRLGAANQQAGSLAQLGLQGVATQADVGMMPINSALQLTGMENAWLGGYQPQSVVPSFWTSLSNNVQNQQAIVAQQRAQQNAVDAQNTANWISGAGVGTSFALAPVTGGGSLFGNLFK